MKKDTGKKLKLHRETLGVLRENALREVAGQALKGPTAIDCSITCLAAPDQTSFNCL